VAREPRGLVGPTGTLGVDVYRRRRQKLMERVGGGAILVAQEAKWEGARSGMDYYYLTGIDEDGGRLLLLPDAPVFKEVLYLATRDVEAERWEGERAPLSRALEVSTGIAKLRRVSGIHGGLVSACTKYGFLAYVGDFVPYPREEPAVMDLYGKATSRTLDCRIKDLHGVLAEMRLVKEPEELALLRKAIDITALGHEAALSAVRPFAREYQVKDEIEGAFRRGGSRHVAFDSITGSGPNSTVLHYPKDDRAMQGGELIVVDIGAEAEYYAADVTRTLPVGGRYTPAQREIVNLVLEAQKAGIARARAGATLEEIDLATRDVIEKAGYYDHYLHSCCHTVGLEVHDVGEWQRPLPVGAVITVEPGVYLPEKGFGVRIEDEVLITRGEAEVLTRAIPKDPGAIEALMAEARK
jgi:Xaa-Pro aminopeptidase